MTPSEIQSILQKQFPVATIQYVGEGWTSTAFCVDDKIIRVPKTTADKYKKEANVLNFLHKKLTVAIPQPQVIESELTYAIHTKIEGNPWSIESYNALSEQEKNDFCRDIATFFYELHKIPLADVMAVLPSKDLQLHTLMDRPIIHSYLHDEFSETEIDKLYDFTNEINIPQTDLVLLHKDFHDNNSLVNEHHRLVGVFDFANTGLGERVSDFRPLYYPTYIPLLEKVLSFYNEMTGITIKLDRIRDLDRGDCLFCLQYFGRNPHLKETMSNDWHKQVSRAREILKEL